MKVELIKGREGLRSLGIYRDDVVAELLNKSRFSVTRYYLSLVEEFNENDPIFLQCIPTTKELSLTGEVDPLNEDSFSPVDGIIRRYRDRVLVLLTNKCFTYCRHCNRRRKWQEPERDITRGEMEKILTYIRENNEIREVILSGGDPLTINPDNLEFFLFKLRKIPHVEVIRIGSRTPVVSPQVITPEICRMLSRYRPIWFNTQFNHVKEVTSDSATACDRLLCAGIPVSNQSVLLRGVNDSVDEMGALLRALNRIMVRPYYLFYCEDVRGVMHFKTDVLRGIEILESLRNNLGGLCIPTYCVDTPGLGGKIPLVKNSIISLDKEFLVLKNNDGDIIKIPRLIKQSSPLS